MGPTTLEAAAASRGSAKSARLVSLSSFPPTTRRSRSRRSSARSVPHCRVRTSSSSTTAQTTARPRSAGGRASTAWYCRSIWVWAGPCARASATPGREASRWWCRSTPTVNTTRRSLPRSSQNWPAGGRGGGHRLRGRKDIPRLGVETIGHDTGVGAVVQGVRRPVHRRDLGLPGGGRVGDRPLLGHVSRGVPRGHLAEPHRGGQGGPGHPGTARRDAPSVGRAAFAQASPARSATSSDRVSSSPSASRHGTKNVPGGGSEGPRGDRPADRRCSAHRRCSRGP